MFLYVFSIFLFFIWFDWEGGGCKRIEVPFTASVARQRSRTCSKILCHAKDYSSAMVTFPYEQNILVRGITQQTDKKPTKKWQDFYLLLYNNCVHTFLGVGGILPLYSVCWSLVQTPSAPYRSDRAHMSDSTYRTDSHRTFDKLCP